VRERGWTPVMDYFRTGTGLSILEHCRLQLRECDAVIGIVAWRLGLLPPPEKGGDGRRSYTQFELEAAQEAQSSRRLRLHIDESRVST
jgi:hypothetical protein